MDEAARNETLAAFQARYGITFVRETFTLDQPNERGEFVLPAGRDPLPPIGCRVKVHGYDGRTFQAVVTGVDKSARTYTAILVHS